MQSNLKALFMETARTNGVVVTSIMDIPSTLKISFMAFSRASLCAYRHWSRTGHMYV